MYSKINDSNFTFKLCPWPQTLSKLYISQMCSIQTSHWLVCIHTNHTYKLELSILLTIKG